MKNLLTVCAIALASGLGSGASAATVDYRLDFELNDTGSTTVGRFNDETIYGGGGPGTNNAQASAIAENQFAINFGVVITAPDYDSSSDLGTADAESPNQAAGRTLPLALFDTDCVGATCAGGDPDLATGPTFDSPSEDTILIVNENLTGATDDVVGGDIIFTFTTDLFPYGANITSIIFIDFDDGESDQDIQFISTDTGGVITTFEASSFNVETSAPSGFIPGTPDPDFTNRFVNPDGADPNNSDNAYNIFTFGDSIVRQTRSFEVNFQNISGGIAVVNYSTDIPLPAPVFMLLSGLGLIVVMRRRRAGTAAAA